MVNDLWCRSETESLLWMCTHDFAAWRMLVSKSLVMIHCGTTLMCDLPWTPPLKQFLCCLSNDQATSIISIGSKGHTTFMCGRFSFDLGSDYSYKFPLHPLCKGGALELFSVDRQLISSHNGDWISPAVEMQEFVHSLSYLTHIFPKQASSSHMRKTDEQHDQMDFYPQMHDLLLANVNSQPLAYQWY